MKCKYCFKNETKIYGICKRREEKQEEYMPCILFNNELFDFEKWFKDINKQGGVYELSTNLPYGFEIHTHDQFSDVGCHIIAEGETLLKLAEDFEREKDND